MSVLHNRFESFRSDARRSLAAPLLTALLSGAATTASGQQAAGSDQQPSASNYAQELSNPVADLTSIPLQFNFAKGVGPDDGTRTILNVQPVVPFHLSDDWNLIARWIMPLVSQPPLGPGLESSFGMGDILFSSFFSPNPKPSNGQKPSALTWGVGPALSLPVSSDPSIGSGKWSAGPTVVVIWTRPRVVYGVLVNQLWDFEDAIDENRPHVNQTFVQPFFVYTRPGGTSFTINTESTYNREAADGDEWTVPINVTVSKVSKLGPFPFQVAGGIGWYARAPANGPDWQLRAQFTVILPGS